jgi:antirestriction protein ArdC
VLLIAAQRPDATRVAGIRTWNGLGRRVTKGEHGIAILAPCVYRTDDHAVEDQEHASPKRVTGRSDEMPPQRELRGFRVVHVFDVTQTEGRPLPDVRPELLTGAAPAGIWDQLVALTANAGYQLERQKCPEGVNGWTAPQHKIVVVEEALEPAQAAKTLAHELGHIRANHAGRFPDYAVDHTCRGAAEVEAESIAYVITSHLGMNPDAYSVPYVAGWADNLDVLRHHMSTVVTVAQGLLSDLAALSQGAPATRILQIAPQRAVPGRGLRRETDLAANQEGLQRA